MTLAADFAGGAVLGLSIAAPVGPIGLLCIRRSLEQGALAGIAGGLGTALADAAYAAVAAFGFTALSAGVAAIALPMQVAGIVVLIYLGVRTMIQKPAQDTAPRGRGHGLLFAQTFVLTLANPATIVSFGAVAASLGMAGGAPARAGALVAGTFVGSLAWWIALSAVLATLRTRVTPRMLAWINRGAGLLLIAFALSLGAGLKV